MVFNKLFNKPGYKSPSFAENIASVKKILTKEYADLMHDLMMGDDFEEIIKNNPLNNPRVEELKIYLEKCGIPVYVAPAIYNYSVNSTAMLDVKKRKKSIDDLHQEVYEDLRNNLGTSYPKEVGEPIAKTIIDYYENYNFKGKTQEQVAYDATMIARSLGINMGPVSNFAYKMNKIAKVKENIPILDYALETHEVKKIDNNQENNRAFVEEDLVVYRAITISRDLKEKCGGNLLNLAGMSIRNNFPTSTSKTYEQSFAKRRGYDLVFEITVPKGSRGIDIEALSNYGKAEGEILFARNSFHIHSVEYKEDDRGQMKYFAKCTLDQKELIKDRTLLEKASKENGYAREEEEREEV